MTKPNYGISVDGACEGNPGPGEWRGVDLATGKILFRSGDYKDGTNNIFEFLAVVHALAYAKMHFLDVPIYSDSQTARAWIKNHKCGTFHHTGDTELQHIIQRADEFLAKNVVPNIEVWRTKEWGESPSDYGRK